MVVARLGGPGVPPRPSFVNRGHPLGRRASTALLATLGRFGSIRNECPYETGHIEKQSVDRNCDSRQHRAAPQCRLSDKGTNCCSQPCPRLIDANRLNQRYPHPSETRRAASIRRNGWPTRGAEGSVSCGRRGHRSILTDARTPMSSLPNRQNSSNQSVPPSTSADLTRTLLMSWAGCPTG
jgi:hypothetical protein